MIVAITGTRKGIGRHIAEYFLDAGSIVFGCSREPSELVHPNYRHYCLDVGDEDAVKNFFRDIRMEHGCLDVLVNNAGEASMNHFLLTPVASLIQIFRSNLVGTFLCSREAAKLMKKVGVGRIVNFSTIAVPLRLAGSAAYAASKSAVVSLTEITSRELSPFGITVNAIGPTPVRTSMLRTLSKETVDAVVSQQTIKRLGDMNDIINVVKFFISPESSFITGQTIYLGGVFQ